VAWKTKGGKAALWDDIVIGAALIGWTAIVHGAFMVVGLKIFPPAARNLRHHIGRAVLITVIVLWFFMATILEAWSWAVVYRMLGIFADMETALYFSTVCFTTLGFGDIILDQHYRLLGAFQAAGGMVIFGWTTAMVFDAVQKVYRPHGEAHK